MKYSIKKILSAVLAAVIVFGVLSVTSNGYMYVFGDIDNDDEITMLDYYAIKCVLNNAKEADEDWIWDADIDGDGEITMLDSYEYKYRIKKGNWRPLDIAPVYTVNDIEEFRSFVADPSSDLASYETSVFSKYPYYWDYEDPAYNSFEYDWDYEDESGESPESYPNEKISDKWYGLLTYDYEMTEFVLTDSLTKDYINKSSGISVSSIDSKFIIENMTWIPAVLVVIADGEYFFIELFDDTTYNNTEFSYTYGYEYKLYTYDEYFSKYEDVEYGSVVCEDGGKVTSRYIYNLQQDSLSSNEFRSIIPLSCLFEAIGGQVTYNGDKTVEYYSYDGNEYMVAYEENGSVEKTNCLYKLSENGVYEQLQITSWGYPAEWFVIDGELMMNDVAMSIVANDLGYTGEFVGNDYYLSEFEY